MNEKQKIVGAGLSSYSPEDQAFFRFWYSHMKNDLMQPPLVGVRHSTARYIWDAAMLASSPQPEAAPAVAQVPQDELLSLLQRARLYTNGACVHAERAPFAVFRSDLDAAIAALEKQ